MSPETAYLRRLATRVVEAAARLDVRAALLVGSAGRGDADCFSDLDLLFYVEHVPTDAELEAVRVAVGGETPLRRWETTAFANGEEFQLGGVRTEVSFTLVERAEWLLDRLLVDLDDVASPTQKFLSGLAEGMPLYGDDLIRRWQARVRAYPEPFRLEMIRRHWNFFPLWYHGEAMSLRDAELWRLDVLLEGVFNVLGVLAAINRIYFTRFELKRTRDLISRDAGRAASACRSDRGARPSPRPRGGARVRTTRRGDRRACCARSPGRHRRAVVSARCPAATVASTRRRGPELTRPLRRRVSPPRASRTRASRDRPRSQVTRCYLAGELRSQIRRRPSRVRNGSTCEIVRECGAIRSASPPVATTRASTPSSRRIASTIPSTWPAKP